MNWQRLLGAAAVIVAAATSGCESAPASRTARLGVPPSALVPSSETVGIRLQKPDEEVRTTSAISPPPLPPSGPGESEVVAVVLATVNGAPILDSEVREAAIGPLSALARLPEGERLREAEKIINAVLDQIIDRELLYQEAITRVKKSGKKDILDKLREAANKDFDRWVRVAKANFKNDEEFRQFLASRETSLEGQRRLRERMFIAEEYLRSGIMRYVDRAANHQEVLDYYRSHPEEFTRGDSVQWQDIFIRASKFPTREEAQRFAEALAARARTGEDFVRLCVEYDDGLSAGQQGAGIGTRRGEIKPVEAEPVVFRLREGEVGPVIELSTGFHIVKVVKREYAGLMPLDAKVQTTIRDKLRNVVYQRERKQFLEELRRNAVIDKKKRPPGS
jgi:parvulin-like peptidyl-prolyl isomerase